MSLSLKQQMRFLKETDPVLFEAINKCYHRSLYESEEYVDNDDSGLDDVQETTKGVQALLQKVHDDVGINPNQKEGTQIYTKTPDDEIPDATIIPEQNPLAYGSNPSESAETDDIFGDLFMDDSTKETTAADESTTSEENEASESESYTSTVTEEDTTQSDSADTKEKDENEVTVDDDI